jgi:O-antigen chain-terminating methyltransferase
VIDRDCSRPSDLDRLIQQLPEVYQPIFGHPDVPSSRGDRDGRMTMVLDVVGRLRAVHGRDLHILDLGSAQGYAAFVLAKEGHDVTGVDFDEHNVELAHALRLEHPGLAVQFLQCDLRDLASTCDLPSFDLVLGLSVLHHLAHRDGHAAAVDLVRQLAAAIPEGLFEMALPTEPVYWAGALPSDPRVTLSPYAHHQELARFATHLSNIERPLLYCSQRHAVVGGDLVPFSDWTSRSHEESDPLRVRVMRYYQLDGGVLKVAARFEEPADEAVLAALRQELRREAHLLEAFAGTDLELPALIDFLDGPDETRLARATHPGLLLSSLLGSLSQDARTNVFGAVLQHLARLESHGLYHGDLRLWNVVVDPTDLSVAVIDHGSVRSEPEDLIWPYDAYFSFAVFTVALWTGCPDQTGVDFPRSLDLRSGDLPARVADLLALVVTHPRNGQVFADLQARWSAYDSARVDEFAEPVAWSWLTALDDHRRELDAQRRTLEAQQRDIEAEQERLDALVTERDEHVAALEQDLLAAESQQAGARRTIEALSGALAKRTHEVDQATDELGALHEVLAATEVELDDARARAEALDDELRMTKDTVSWRITTPLRSVRRYVPRPTPPDDDLAHP